MWTSESPWRWAAVRALILGEGAGAGADVNVTVRSPSLS